MKTLIPALVALAAASPAASASIDTVPPLGEIVARTDRVAYYQGKDGRARVRMTIVDAQGRERERRFTILRADEQPARGPDEATGEQKYYVHIQQPSDLRDTVFMVWKHIERDDDRWLYLPALDLVKRIAAGDKRTSFLGSHFFYEDISGRNLTEDEHELLEVTDDYFVLQSTPKDPSTVEFDHFKMWIHRGSFLPVQVEFYDDTGARYRSYRALRVETIDGYPTVVESRMDDLRGGGHTVLSFERVAYDVGIPDDVFSERYLRKAPREYLR